jgi:hypothetical protein
VEIRPELSVDTSRGEKLRINMDVVFHSLPCSCKRPSLGDFFRRCIDDLSSDLSVDAMDISGEHQLDVDHNIFKKRIAPNGRPVEEKPTREQRIQHNDEAL